MLISNQDSKLSHYVCDKCGVKSADRKLYLHGLNYVFGGYQASPCAIEYVAEPSECHGFVSVVLGNQQVHYCPKCADKNGHIES